MVSIEYSEAAVEVLEILNELEDKEFNKIPTRVINFFEECKSKTYNPKIDYTAEVESLNLKEKTREILAGIYLDYLCPEIDKEEYVKKIRINNYKHEEELKKKYDVDNIFKNRKDDFEEQQALKIIEKESIFSKIIKKIKSFFR